MPIYSFKIDKQGNYELDGYASEAWTLVSDYFNIKYSAIFKQNVYIGFQNIDFYIWVNRLKPVFVNNSEILQYGIVSALLHQLDRKVVFIFSNIMNT